PHVLAHEVRVAGPGHYHPGGAARVGLAEARLLQEPPLALRADSALRRAAPHAALRAARRVGPGPRREGLQRRPLHELDRRAAAISADLRLEHPLRDPRELARRSDAPRARGVAGVGTDRLPERRAPALLPDGVGVRGRELSDHPLL